MIAFATVNGANPILQNVTVSGANYAADPSSFDINKFRSHLNNSYHRTNQFQMYVTVPKALNGASLFGQNATSASTLGNAAKDLMFDIERVIMPGVSLATDEVRRYGYGYFDRKPYAPVFEEMNIIVRSDGDGKNYDFFQTWMRSIINYGLDGGSMNTFSPGYSSAPYEINYKKNYASSSNILAYNEDGQIAIQLSMRNCFPIYLGEMQYDWGDNNNVVRFPVRFTFSDWTQSRSYNVTNLLSNS